MTDANNLDKTQKESRDTTIKINHNNNSDLNVPKSIQFTHFMDYSVLHSYPAIGGEADIFQISKNNQEFVLKLYREGIIPNDDILSKILALSKDHPKQFIKMLEYGFDRSIGRWFEILEYAKYRTLKEFLCENKLQKADLDTILREIFDCITTLHEHNIVHLDIKPANILVRSINPLDLVMTDFGVASIFKDQFSHKMTTKKGTPQYWAPEQLSGYVGREADYWALGMIMLESVEGRHPFDGIREQHIVYTLTMTGVSIPANLPYGYEMLLKGLLTKNPEKRWGADQVADWINGSRVIPVSYEYIVEDQKPYTFQGMDFSTPEDLVSAFIVDEKNWKAGTKHLGKGFIKNWLKEVIKDYDHVVILDDIIENKNLNIDKQLFSLIYSFNNSLPFVVYGKNINLNNLYLFSGKTINNTASEAEFSIIKDITSGELHNYSNLYIDFTHNTDPIHEVIAKLNGKNSAQIFTILEIALHPERYLVPSNIENNNLIDTVSKLSNLTIGRNNIPIFTIEEFRSLTDQFILPRIMEDNVQNHGWSTQVFDRIKEFQDRNLLIHKNEATMDIPAIKTLLNAPMDDGGNIKVNGIWQNALDKYISIAQYLNWGINQKNIQKVKELKEINFDNTLNSYFDALLSKRIPWTEFDSKFVNQMFFKYNFIKKVSFLFTRNSFNVIIFGIILSTLFGIILKMGIILNNMLITSMYIENSPNTVYGIIWTYIIFTAILLAITLPIFHLLLKSFSERYRNSERISKTTIHLLFTSIILYYWFQFVAKIGTTGKFTSSYTNQYYIAIPTPIFKNFFDFIIPGGMIFIYAGTIFGLILLFKRKLVLEGSKKYLSPFITANKSYMASVISKWKLSKEISDVF